MSQGPTTALSAIAAPFPGKVGTFSPALALLPGVQGLLGTGQLVCVPRSIHAHELNAIVSWAGDESVEFSRRFAAQHGLPWWRVAPGFVYRVGVRGHAEPPLSLVFDQTDAAHDGREETSLVRHLNTHEELTGEQHERARGLIQRILRGRISTWNNVLAPRFTAANSDNAAVLVIVDGGLEPAQFVSASPERRIFQEMFEAAKREHPDARILLKVPKAGGLGLPGWVRTAAHDRRVEVIEGRVNSFELLERVRHVYVVNAHLGFEALMANKTVSCFGVPWYAGWGLTQDRTKVVRRSRIRDLEALFFAAYVQCTRYADPESGGPWQIEDTLSLVERQNTYFQLNRGTIYCHGFTLWKRTFVRAYLRSPGNQVVFARTASALAWRRFDSSSKLLVWGTKEQPEISALAARHGVPIWRMEDGFLRSVGLGADLTVPASLVVDRAGIYFDPQQPSSLEKILQTEVFSENELSRAQALRGGIVAAAISKYNVGDRAVQLMRPPTHQTVILVPGQVEDDASIKRGCRDVRTNAALLQAVREANPDAFIVFKPHPDVTDAKRVGAVPEDVARRYVDEVLLGVPLPACLAIVDEVHTLTSLVGFEALLRGLKVATYGLPFYAGWGLTKDRHSLARRTRKLTLDELVAGVLIRYPRYLGSQTRMFTTPEAVVRQLQKQMEASSRVSGGGRMRRELRRASHAIKVVLDVP